VHVALRAHLFQLDAQDIVARSQHADRIDQHFLTLGQGTAPSGR
jgi:hypothetical protein